jgi:hypothetical protein
MKHLVALLLTALACSASHAAPSDFRAGQPSPAAPKVLVQVDCQTGEPVLDSAGKQIIMVEEQPRASAQLAGATTEPELSDKPKECARRSPSNNGCSGGECTEGTCKETGLSMNSCKCFK